MLLQLDLVHGNVEAPRPVVVDSGSGQVKEVVTECRPCIRRLERPLGIFPHAFSLTLDPDQAEIAASRTHGVVSLVNETHIQPALAEPVGKSRAQKAATNHADIKSSVFHLLSII